MVSSPLYIRRLFERARNAGVKYVAKFLLLIIVLGSAAGAASVAYDFFHLRVSGLHGVAKVVSASSQQVAGSRGGTSYRSSVTVEFATAGGVLVKHEFNGTFSGIKPGAEVGIFYNPAAPEEVIADTWDDLILAAALLGMALACWVSILEL
nr:DUF3592 domain-containing protein [Pseudomonas sp. Fl4BN1]